VNSEQCDMDYSSNECSFQPSNSAFGSVW